MTKLLPIRFLTLIVTAAALSACGADSRQQAVDQSPTGGSDGGANTSVGVTADPCIAANSCPAGTWINVTPTTVDLVDPLDCSNFGTQSVQVDPLTPSVLYTEFHCQGIWKSTDYGLTWNGPINTGPGGTAAGDAAGGLVLPPAGVATEPPVIYAAAIRGAGTGFWKSTNGGVDWTNYMIGTDASRQDYYPPVVDPYDANHLLMTAHEQNIVVESTDGGQTWNQVALAAGMNPPGGTDTIFFIDTGSASTTRGNWMWMAQQTGGTHGTWRTTNAGGLWQQVDSNEHPHGAWQIYQPDTSGIVYMGGSYSAHGNGVLRSLDYGLTWDHVGGTKNESIVFGSANNVYAMFGWAIGTGLSDDPSLEIGAQPGTAAWAATPTPPNMTQGPAQAAVTSNGTHAVFVVACFSGGLWRYVEL